MKIVVDGRWHRRWQVVMSRWHNQGAWCVELAQVGSGRDTCWCHLYRHEFRIGDTIDLPMSILIVMYRCTCERKRFIIVMMIKWIVIQWQMLWLNECECLNWLPRTRATSVMNEKYASRSLEMTTKSRSFFNAQIATVMQHMKHDIRVLFWF